MSRILLDQNMPIGLRAAIPNHEVITSFEMGWAGLENGKLLAAAEAAGFDVMLTSDQNIRHQQNLTGIRLALVVLSTNHWPTIKQQAATVRNAVDNARPTSYTNVHVGCPPVRRGPPPER